MGRARVIVYSTVTVDGRIASKTGFSKLSCPTDLRRLHELRAKLDAVMVGANTVIRDDPALRVKYVKTAKNPVRVVVDGRLRTPLGSRVYTLDPRDTIVLTTDVAPLEKLKKLRELGVRVLVYNNGPEIDLGEALADLYALGIRSVLTEGGGGLIWSLFKYKVVDELRVTLSPYVFGGRDSTSLVMGDGFSSTRDSPRLKPVDVLVCDCGLEVHIRYQVVSYGLESVSNT